MLNKADDPSLSAVPYQECSLEAPGNGHFCQIHQNETALASTAVRYLRLGAVKGENLVVITNESRQVLLSKWLEAAGVHASKLLKSRRLFLHASSDVMNAVCVDGMPDWDRFERTATEMFDQASWAGEKRIRFYGDAVSELWASGSHEAVVMLEEFWARFKENSTFDSACFCGYVIDALDPGSYSEYLPHLGRSHGFVMGARDNDMLSAVLDRAGRKILGFTLSKKTRSSVDDQEWKGRLPDVFRNAYWLGQNYPSAMPDVLGEAKRIHSI